MLKSLILKLSVTGIDPIFYYFLGAGFLFAMIDGAIGMSYGVTSTSFSFHGHPSGLGQYGRSLIRDIELWDSRLDALPHGQYQLEII
jgi:hypothetical protein